MSATHFLTIEPCKFDSSLLAVVEYEGGLSEVVCYVPDHRHAARILDAITITEGVEWQSHAESPAS